MNRLRDAITTVVLAGALGPVQAAPSGGWWEMRVTLEAAPTGSGTHTQQACLLAEQLARAPERSFFEASRRQGERAPRCEWRQLERSAEGRARWQASCDSPFGAAKGQGHAVIGSDSAQLSQQVTLDTPLGSRTVAQRIEARRIGACP
jgi:Protein of unknown function (DUF3617)